MHICSSLIVIDEVLPATFSWLWAEYFGNRKGDKTEERARCTKGMNDKDKKYNKRL